MSKGQAAALERLLLERLEGVVTDPASVLRRALALAGISAVPSEPIEVSLFCRGALDEALAEALGGPAAQALTEELDELAAALPRAEETPAAVASGTRRRRPMGSETRKRRVAFVVVASRDEARGASVLEALSERAQAVVASDVFQLMQAVEDHLDREVALVIDGSVPGLAGPMWMALARILPPSARVVFWGAPTSLGSAEIGATTLAADATPDEVARCVSEGADEDEPRGVILLADDDPVWLSTLARRLRHEGYDVVAVADGLAALEALIDHRPALILTDFDMPALDGQQLATLVVGRLGEAAPPILMLTSSEIGPAPGVTRVMDKCAPFEEILAEVRSHLTGEAIEPLARPG